MEEREFSFWLPLEERTASLLRDQQLARLRREFWHPEVILSQQRPLVTPTGESAKFEP